MAYPVAANFRTATLAEYCAGLALTPDEADDAKLTLTIARMVDRIESLCDDEFVSAAGRTYELRGSGTSQLALPARCTAVTTVKTRDYNGNLTTQAATAYRLVSTLDTAGATRVSGVVYDYLEIPPNQHLTGVVLDTGWTWPVGAETVQVVGTFGWTVTPPDINRAVALLTHDAVKSRNPSNRKATIYDTVDTRYEQDVVGPTADPDVNRIVADFTRSTGELVG
jgi:hypothetical protein